MGEPSATAQAFRPAADGSYKLMYLPQRNPRIAAEDFPEAWRSHARFAGQFATTLGQHFLSSRQCVKEHAEGLGPTFDNDRDGCAILAMKSWADLLAARYHPVSAKELLEDEVRVFADLVDQWTMAVEEHVLAGGEPTGHLLLSFLRRLPDQDAPAFRDASRARAHALAAGEHAPARLAWSAVVDPAAAFAFDAVIEAWYPDREAALAAARDPRVTAVLEQRELADPQEGFRLFARLNLARRPAEAAAGRS